MDDLKTKEMVRPSSSPTAVRTGTWKTFSCEPNRSGRYDPRRIIPVGKRMALIINISPSRSTFGAIRVVLDPGLQHDASEAVPRHVHVAVQPLLLRLAQAVVDRSCNLDRIREISEPSGGDPGPEANSGQLFLNLCNQWRILLSRNLRGSSLNQAVPGQTQEVPVLRES